MLTVKQSRPDLVRITEFLQETSVLGNSLDTECLILTPDSIHKVVVRDSDGSRGAANIGGVYTSATVSLVVDRHTLECDGLLGRVYFLSLRFVHGDLSLLVPCDVSGGLNDTSGLEGSDSDGR